jgi:hypothetical protein
MDRVGAHEIDKILLRPGQSVNFEDRDHLLETLDRLDQRVPARHEGRTGIIGNTSACCVTCVSSPERISYPIPPRDSEEAPEGQDPPDFILE